MVIVVMAIATIIEKYHGTQYVSENIYGSWWFAMLWGILTASAIIYFLKRKVRRLSVVTLHLSFVLILAGALLTHLTARQGTIHLRQGEVTVDEALPFSIRLDKFNINYHEGTMAASNYVSQFTVIDNDSEVKGETSMNSIFSHRGIRLYQSGYDPENTGDLHRIRTAIPLTGMDTPRPERTVPSDIKRDFTQCCPLDSAAVTTCHRQCPAHTAP